MYKGQRAGNKSFSLDCKQGTDRWCIYEHCDCECHAGKVYHWGRWKSAETRRRHELGLQEPETWFLSGDGTIRSRNHRDYSVRV